MPFPRCACDCSRSPLLPHLSPPASRWPARSDDAGQPGGHGLLRRPGRRPAPGPAAGGRPGGGRVARLAGHQQPGAPPPGVPGPARHARPLHGRRPARLLAADGLGQGEVVHLPHPLVHHRRRTLPHLGGLRHLQGTAGGAGRRPSLVAAGAVVAARGAQPTKLRACVPWSLVPTFPHASPSCRWPSPPPASSSCSSGCWSTRATTRRGSRPSPTLCTASTSQQWPATRPSRGRRTTSCTSGPPGSSTASSTCCSPWPTSCWVAPTSTGSSGSTPSWTGPPRGQPTRRA